MNDPECSCGHHLTSHKTAPYGCLLCDCADYDGTVPTYQEYLTTSKREGIVANQKRKIKRRATRKRARASRKTNR